MAYVALDYGHGENTWEDTGGKGVIEDGKAYEEHHFNSDVGEQVRKILERHGVKVLVTQPPYSEDVGLEYRTDLANRENVDLFASIHANAGTPSASGACVFAWEGFAGANRAADLVVKYLKEARINLHGNGRHYSRFYYPGTDDWHWTNFHVLRETDMSAILIESGFMTNDEDFENIFGINKEEFRDKIAEAIAKGILVFFGITYKGEVPSDPMAKGYLMLGDEGDSVEKLQGFLQLAGYDVEMDGIFGPNTEAKVRKFQSDHNLVVDGFYGPKTQAKMKAVLSPNYETSSDTIIGSVTIKGLPMNYRTMPDVRAPIIRELPAGHKADLYEVKDEWLRLGDGWVSNIDGAYAIVKIATKEDLHRVLINGKQVGAYAEDSNVLSVVKDAIKGGKSNVKVEKVDR